MINLDEQKNLCPCENCKMQREITNFRIMKLFDTVTIPSAEYEQMKVNAEYIKRLEDVAKHFDEAMAWELGGEPIPSLSIAARALYKSVLASRPEKLGVVN